MEIRAISLDLDDTLWPLLPALTRAETRLDAWLAEHHPEVARQFPVAAMRALREEIAAEREDLAHDFSAQRRLTLTRAFERCGRDCAPVEDAFAVYFEARNSVEPYADTVDALTRMARHVPLVSLSNGNADLARIGLDHLFQARFSARQVGVAKPHPRMFDTVRRHLGLSPAQILHVGDDPLTDVAGARRAGFRTAWINREGREWPPQAPADLELRDLTTLAAWVERSAPSTRRHPPKRRDDKH